jgi:ABC-2 type transport system ATP-binding protein
MVAIRNLTFGYRKEKLFSGLALELKPGSIHGLLGKNGVGKTTLLKLISGLRYPQDGECRVWDYVPQKRMPGMLEDLYLIPEEFFVPPMTMKTYEKIYASFYPRFDGEALGKYEGEFDLDVDKKLTELSYGQKKKFLLAFGLATNCRLFLLDEPTNGLDIPSKSQFRRVLASALTDDRIIIISTHQVRDMENLIDDIIILEDGKIVFNQYVHDISSRLTFTVDHELPETDEVIYAEKVLGGYMVVKENRSEEESRVELETLFNAVIAEGEKINGLFPGEAS